MLHKEFGQARQHVIRVEPTRDADGQTLASELVDYCEHFKRSPVHRAVGDEIVGPHVVRVLWPQPDAGAVVEPQPPAFRLSGRYFEPLTPPDALYPLGVDPPAFGSQQGGNAPIAVAAVCAGQPDDRRAQRRFVIARQARLALGRAGLANRTTGAPLRNPQFLPQMRDALAPAFGA